jgi:hypothetical protein
MGDARSLAKGGTSAVESSTPVPLIIGGVCVLAAVVVAIVVFSRGESKKEIDDTFPNDGEVAGKAAAGDDGASDAGADDDDELSPARGSEQSAARTEALATLADELKTARLWSDVSTDRLDATKIVVRTQYCEDERLRSTINDVSSDLSTAGFTAVQCFEQHGALVFEDEL